jgi:type VI secretion system protein ImpH
MNSPGAAPGTSTTTAVVDPRLATLLADAHLRPWAHDFYALLRAVEALAGSPRFGQARRPAHEPLRLGQDAELDFASAPLARLELDRPHAPRLGVRFFGLLGPQGPLPLHLTEWVRERQRSAADDTAARFLDLLQHRLLALFYRAWAEAQPAVQNDRPAQDRYAVWLGAPIGLDRQALSADAGHPTADAAQPAALPARDQLFQAGLLSGRSRHPEGLRALLTQAFGVPVHIIEHVAHWMVLEDDDRTRLGRPGLHRSAARPSGSARSGSPTWTAPRLGLNTVAGHRRRDRQFKFRIVIGPLGLADYRSFLPGGARAARLADWVRRYVGADLAWDLTLCLHGDQVPEPRLGRDIALGQTSWLRSPRPPAAGVTPQHRADLHLHPGRCRAAGPAGGASPPIP